ncbi:MAG TPA: sulfite exporter TauE/SafE family protein [Cytophagales bacterium]|nr:sulfite exporter TauE/SafE family protein [Cytophagales bacterium]
MDILIIYIPALIIGIFLGLMGGGGSILTVPIFVYIAGLSPLVATGYSLFVVGTTSLVGAFTYARKKLLNLPVAVSFFLPSFIMIFMVRKYLLPSIPEEIAQIGSFILTKNLAIMLFFAGAMMAASFSMIKSGNATVENMDGKMVNYQRFFAQAIAVGLITGIAGAGGGFLIVPTLVLLAHLKMRLAVGTSLFIIAINSLIGFTGDLLTLENIDWSFLIIFSAIAISGIFIGTYLSELISAQKLKKVFGWFILIMSIVVFFSELNK